MQVAVIGGGAAGFFAALSALEHRPEATITLFEKSDKLLSKVRISGGGRCNVTHDEPSISRLVKSYPRGAAFLRKAFTAFAVPDTIAWFQRHKVTLKTESDGRMFPVTDDSGTIVNALMEAAAERGVRIKLRSAVTHVEPIGEVYRLCVNDQLIEVDKVIITTGGHPKREAYDWLQDLGHRIVPPAPSLFTFNIPDRALHALMGVALPARARIVGTALESTGPVLITHWGLSGPAILKLSAWGARELNERAYQFTVQLNWAGGRSEDELRSALQHMTGDLERWTARNADPFHLPSRFWEYQLARADIDPARPWGTIPRKSRNRLLDLLTNDRYEVRGKTTFKEEFVTAGGVELAEVDPTRMESRLRKGLHFAGEVLDIDGITGGFNFQAAWTTGFIAGRSAVA
ncbi:MAG: NAD(P)/FAD-dependent oxidoreductase [Flavobacteriales bacterium]